MGRRPPSSTSGTNSRRSRRKSSPWTTTRERRSTRNPTGPWERKRESRSQSQSRLQKPQSWRLRRRIHCPLNSRNRYTKYPVQDLELLFTIRKNKRKKPCPEMPAKYVITNNLLTKTK